MSLAKFADAHFAFPGKDILTGASLLIRPGDRMALLGPNGTGKSTVLKLLAGELSADAGDVRMLGRASVAYLQQSQQQSGDGSVLDALLEPFAHLRAMHDEMVLLEARLGAADPADLKRYGELQERYGFTLSREQLKVAVNSEFAPWSRKLAAGDAVVFIPPVAGG